MVDITLAEDEKSEDDEFQLKRILRFNSILLLFNPFSKVIICNSKSHIDFNQL